MFGSNANQAPVRPLDWSAASVGTPASTAETVLKSTTIPADSLNVDGKGLRFIFQGSFAANTNLKTVRVRLGPVTLTGTICINTPTTAFNGTNWRVEGRLVRRIVDSQSVFSFFLEDGTISANIAVVQIGTAANDDSTDMFLELTGQNGTATADDILCTGHFVEFIDQP